MVFSPRNPEASRVENRCLDVYASDSEVGGVIYELNFATSFPIPGAPPDIHELFSNIHGRTFFKAYQPAWQEMGKNGVPESEAFERMCFVEFNVLVAICGHLDLEFKKVQKMILAKANSFANTAYKAWQSDPKKSGDSIEKYAVKKYKESFLESSYLWKKAVRDSWISISASESKPSKVKAVIEKMAPGATSWIDSKSNLGNEESDENEFDYLFAVPEVGWTWVCDYHQVFGLCDDENEAHFMAGAHMTYVEIDGDVCEIYFRDWQDGS
jgi:hypothetical protein